MEVLVRGRRPAQERFHVKEGAAVGAGFVPHQLRGRRVQSLDGLFRLVQEQGLLVPDHFREPHDAQGLAAGGRPVHPAHQPLGVPHQNPRPRREALRLSSRWISHGYTDSPSGPLPAPPPARELRNRFPPGGVVHAFRNRKRYFVSDDPGRAGFLVFVFDAQAIFLVAHSKNVPVPMPSRPLRRNAGRFPYLKVAWNPPLRVDNSNETGRWNFMYP